MCVDSPAASVDRSRTRWTVPVQRSVGQPKRRRGTLSDSLLHPVEVVIGSVRVVDDDAALVGHLEDVLGDRLADPVSRAPVEVDVYVHAGPYRTTAGSRLMPWTK